MDDVKRAAAFYKIVHLSYTYSFDSQGLSLELDVSLSEE